MRRPPLLLLPILAMALAAGCKPPSPGQREAERPLGLEEYGVRAMTAEASPKGESPPPAGTQPDKPIAEAAPETEAPGPEMAATGTATAAETEEKTAAASAVSPSTSESPIAKGIAAAEPAPKTPIEAPIPAAPASEPPSDPAVTSAEAFLAETNARLLELWSHWERTEWVKATYITHDTELLAAKAHEEVMAYTAEAIGRAAALDVSAETPEVKRALNLLKTSLSLPAPSDPAARKRLAGISARLGSLYGKGEYCVDGRCQDLGALSAIIADPDASYEAKLDAWSGWRSISRPMRADYATFVELGNAGARGVGFTDLGDLWRSSYDMPAWDFEKEVERLWQQVRPLYEQLHCYVRAKLSEKYGADKVSPDGKIPAHLLGNMWAQEWGTIYPMVEPYPDATSVDITAALQDKKYQPVDMVRMAERFFTSLGLDPLPETFYERSQFTKPRDRDVVCHASAWDVSYSGDLRIKMCIKVDFEDFVTIHHELGHNYYYMYYNTLPALYQSGAHDGFHEGIGDTLALSVTPGYLKVIGVLEGDVERSEESLINLMMQTALDKIAFLPFGRMIDQWRWDVFSGKITPEEMNAGWWRLREKYQGVEAPVERSEADFDPGAKYHIPANTPYMRYFLARILQFQFHRAMCKAAGYEGPLHECSIYGSEAAGDKLKAMLAMGASRPWPEALEALTGGREMDASALVDYFAPLTAWLEKANAGRTCGW